MFDPSAVPSPGHPAVADAALSPALLAGWMRVLAAVPRELPDAERIDVVRALEELKCAAEAAQAVVSADFDESQRREQAAAGVPARRQGAGVAAQIALARRESPARGTKHLGLAKALVDEMPATLTAMARGRMSEWQATLIARETACVSREHRAQIDEAVSGELGALEGKGDRTLAAEAKRLAYALEPDSLVLRSRKAERERTVTIRPAPDTMTWVTALLPVTQGVAAFAALRQAADRARAEGDPRGRGQVMADTFVQRVTGQATPDAVPVGVQLVMTGRALLAKGDDPAELLGHGPIPAAWARDVVARALETRAGAWVKRLFSDPSTGRLVGRDSRRRRVTLGLAEVIRGRDLGTCRTPWCDAPARHIDHVIPHASGGTSTEPNGQGLCEACNYAKQAVGWHAQPRPGPRHTVDVETPTGHTYRSTAPPLPGYVPGRSRVEIYLTEILLSA